MFPKAAALIGRWRPDKHLSSLARDLKDQSAVKKKFKKKIPTLPTPPSIDILYQPTPYHDNFAKNLKNKRNHVLPYGVEP